MLKQNRNRLIYVGGSANPNNRDFWGTPPKWVERCRRVLGWIELDAASCEIANNAVVNAERFFDEKINGLKQSWKCDTLLLCPPFSHPLLNKFATKFCAEWKTGQINQAIILINNVTETKAFNLFSHCASAHAYTRERIQFIPPKGRHQTSNPRGQVFLYCGRYWRRFRNVFAEANCRVLRETYYNE